MKAYPNEKLYAVAKENYSILQNYCEILLQEGYWEEPQGILNQQICDFLALYIQAMLVQVTDYIQARDVETLRMIIGVTGSNPLVLDEETGITARVVEEAKKCVFAPPILLQLCSLRDVEHHSSIAGLFFDAVLNIIFAAAYLNNKNDAAVTRYVREYYARVRFFIQNLEESGACVDEQYIFYKICNGDLEKDTAFLKEAGENFTAYKKEAFLLEDNSKKEEAKLSVSGGAAAVDAQESSADDPTDSGDGYGYSEDEEYEEEYLEEEYEFEDEFVCAKEEEEPEQDLGEDIEKSEEESAVTVLSAAQLLRSDRREEESAQKNDKSAGDTKEQKEALDVSGAQQVLQKQPEVDKEAATRAALASFKAKRMEKLMNRLDELVGLCGVKEEIHSLINLIRVRKMREEYHLPGMPMSYHMVFTGSPGTGKTTVARLVGEIYRELGILSKGMMIETDRAGLVAGYVGQTAIKVKEVVEKARGGILFIDEAYTLSSAVGGNDFGTEAIDMLVKMMEDYREDLVIIVAGYTQEMQTFLKSNTGLISRFNKFIDFPDYKDEELVDILNGMAARAGFSLAEEVLAAVRGYLLRLTPSQRGDFGNARGIRNLFEKMVAAQANRVVCYDQPTKEQLSSIIFEDCKFFA